MINPNIKLLNIWLDISLEKRLYFVMFMIVTTLCSVILYLKRGNDIERLRHQAELDDVRYRKNIQIAEAEAKAEACYQAQLLYLQQEKRELLDIVIKYEKLKNSLENNDN